MRGSGASSGPPWERWYPAIFQRTSRRVFDGRPIDPADMDRLGHACSDFRPFAEARAELAVQPTENIFRGIIGGYGRIKGAPAFIAFIGLEADPRVQEAVGYTGEGLILEATALGLQTCWVGGFFRRDAVDACLRLAAGEKVFAVTPVGHAPDVLSGAEKLMKGFVKATQRKPLAALIAEGAPSAPWMEKAVEAARLAPSAVNRQPWRFAIQGDSIVVGADSDKDAGRISKRLDCGIAMLHLELGALSAGVRGRWEFLSHPQVARFKPA